MLNRRKLITGLISFTAAPAIVKIENIMPVKSYRIGEFLRIRLPNDFSVIDMPFHIGYYKYYSINSQWLEMFNVNTKSNSYSVRR